jgi:hypothetical protein
MADPSTTEGTEGTAPFRRYYASNATFSAFVPAPVPPVQRSARAAAGTDSVTRQFADTAELRYAASRPPAIAPPHAADAAFAAWNLAPAPASRTEKCGCGAPPTGLFLFF